MLHTVYVRMYTNQAANSYQFTFVALHQMSVALPGSSRDLPVYTNTSNKITTIDLARGVQLEIAEVQGVTI